MKKRSKTPKTNKSLREEIIGLGDRSVSKSYYPQLQEQIRLLQEAKKKAEESTTILHLFIKYSPAAIAMFDREMRYVAVSQRWLKDYGLGKKQIIGRSHYEIFSEIPERWKNIHRRCLAGAIEKAEEDPFVRTDGTIDWIRWEIHPWQTTTGEIGGIIIFSEVITEFKKAKDALRESEERWKFALEGSGDGVWDWNAQTNEVFFSRRWKEMLGYEEHEIGNTLDEWDKRVHPDDKKMVYGEIEKHFRGETDVYVSEHRVLCKDGTYKWILDRGKVITKTDDGKPKRVIGTHTDITERKKTELLIKEREALLSEVGAIAKIGGWEMDMATSKATWSKGTYDIVEIDYDEPIPGLHEHVGYYLPEYREMIEGKMKALIETKQPMNFEAALKTAKGNIKWCQAFGEAVVRDGKLIKLQGTFQDITERKEAEQKIKNTVNFLDSVIEQSPYSICISDKHGTLIRMNQACAKLLDITEDEIVGKYNVLKDTIVKEQGLMPLVEAVFKEGRAAHFELTYDSSQLKHLQQKRTKSVMLDVTIFPIRDTKGKITNAVIQHMDITKGRKAEQALRESEQKFRQLAENIREVFFIVSPEWNQVIYISQAYEHVWGQTCESLYSEPQSWLQSVIEEDRKSIASAIQIKTAGDFSQHEFPEYRIRLPNGSIRWIYARVYPILDEHGDIHRIAGIAEDITERKKVEEALRHHEALLSETGRIAKVGGWEFDPITGEGTWTDEVARIHDLDPEEYTNIEIGLSYYHGESGKKIEKAVKEAIELGKPYDLELELVTAKGNHKWIRTIGHPVIENKKVVKVRGSFQDITERKQAEEELKSALKMADDIVRYIPSGMLIYQYTEPDKLYLLSGNLEAEKITGVKVADWIGKEYNETWKGAEASGLTKAYLDVMRTGKNFQTEDWYYKDEKLQGSFRIRAFRLPNDRIAISFDDISERKRADEELRKYREHLEDLVKERTEELEQANIRLKELDRLKSMFIASMSHELRTPLNSVIGFSSILMKDWVGTLNDEQKNMSSIILKAGKHLLSLINDVIDVSKIEAGMIDVHHDDFDIDEVITDAVESLTQEIQDKGLDLQVQTIHQQMHTDRGRLLQCILNLLSNAMKFTEKGSITVQTRIVNSEQYLVNSKKLNTDDNLLTTDIDFVEISVADTGIGIKGEDIPKLFQAFLRLETPLKAVVPGTGLGLYLTKKLLTEVLHGEITVESEYGKGSKFVMKIPISVNSEQ